MSNSRGRFILRVVFLFLVLAITCSTAFAAPWKFMAPCDSRSEGIGGLGVNAVILTEIVDEAFTQDIEVFIFAGDLVAGWHTEPDLITTQLTYWKSIMQPIYDDANMILYTTRGNHEVAELTPPAGSTVWNTVFTGQYANPDNGPAGEENMTHSFTHKNAFFVGLDPHDGLNDDIDYHRINQRWLDGQLAGNSQPHVFVYSHEPAFKCQHTDILDDFPTERNTFWQSLTNAGARAYFCGHDHFYGRAHVDDNDGDPNNDIRQYIAGALSILLYDDEPYDGDNAPYTVTAEYYAKMYGYVMGEVDGLDVTLTWWERDSNNLSVAGTYSVADTWSYTALPPDANIASIPIPQSGAEDVDPANTSLGWTPGEKADTHNIYLGTNQQNVIDANTTITLGVYADNVDTNSYDPNLQEFTQYYWRIDEVNDTNTWKGDVWYFTTGFNPRFASNPDWYRYLNGRSMVHWD